MPNQPSESREPKISVVIPTFNRRAFLREAIASVLAQSYPVHEIIVVDDGGSDGSEAVADMSPLVRYLWQPNAGPSAARNAGIEAATGDAMALLDSDDLWHPQRAASSVGVMQSHPESDVVFGEEVFFGNRVSEYTFADSRCLENPALEIIEGLNIPTSSVLIRRSALGRHRFNPSIRLCEDMDLWLTLAEAGASFSFSRDIQIMRRMHSGNLVSARLELKEAACEVLMAHFPNHHCDTERAAIERRVSSHRYDIGSAQIFRGVWADARANLFAVQVEYLTLAMRVKFFLKLCLCAVIVIVAIAST